MSSAFAWVSQNRSWVSSGQPGAEQGRAGLLGIAPTVLFAWVSETLRSAGVLFVPEGPFLYFQPLTVFQALTAFSIAGFGYSLTHGCKLVPAIQSYCEAVEGPVLSSVYAVAFDVEVVADHLDSFVLVAFAQEEVFQHEPVVFG